MIALGIPTRCQLRLTLSAGQELVGFQSVLSAAAHAPFRLLYSLGTDVEVIDAAWSDPGLSYSDDNQSLSVSLPAWIFLPPGAVIRAGAGQTYRLWHDYVIILPEPYELDAVLQTIPPAWRFGGIT